jgi:hypothetical protein
VAQLRQRQPTAIILSPNSWSPSASHGSLCSFLVCPVQLYGDVNISCCRYSANLASDKLGSFSVAPGFFRDDPTSPRWQGMCKQQVLWKPCPQYPEQGAASTLWTAAKPGLEDHWNGAMIDFHTTVGGSTEWVQNGVSCVPRPLPPGWSDEDRASFYRMVQAVVSDELMPR